jgi:hypothetical protein
VTRTSISMWSPGYLLVMASLLGSVSCTNSATKKQPTATNSSQENAQKALVNALEMLHPERLNISSERKTAVSLINQWYRATYDDATPLPPLGPVTQKLAEGVIAPENIEQLARDRYDGDDGKHFRTCTMFKAMVLHITQNAESDLQRARWLFDYTVRNIELPPDDATALPQSRYAIALFGKGTAKDRAWIFADLLRQLSIDAVIIRPKSPASQQDGNTDADRWLVGVLIDSQVYLFDPQLGTAIPAPNDDVTSVTVEQPATLAEVRADDGLLRRLDQDAQHPYPLTAADLSAVNVELITVQPFWSPRMERLQATLTGKRSVIIHDPLDDSESSLGLLSRVAEFGKDRWAPEDITVWKHPSKRLHESANLNPNQRSVWALRQLPMRAPVPFRFNPASRQLIRNQKTGMYVMGRAERKMLGFRTMQLMGDYPMAIKRYVMLRLDEPSYRERAAQIPKNDLRTQMWASADCFFWTGVSQMEQEEFAAAVSTFRQYLQRPNGGRWLGLGNTLLGLSFAHTGRFNQAIALLENIPDDDPHRPGYELLVRRWKNRPDAQPERDAQSEPDAQPGPDEPENSNTPVTEEKPTDSQQKGAPEDEAEKTPPSSGDNESSQSSFALPVVDRATSRVP